MATQPDQQAQAPEQKKAQNASEKPEQRAAEKPEKAETAAKAESVEVQRSKDTDRGVQRRSSFAPRSLARRLRRRWLSPEQLLTESPFDLVRRMSDDFDRLFGMTGFFDDDFFTPSAAEQAWAPQIDVFEKNGDLVVRADLPGMKKEDVKVEVLDDRLVIEGERRHEAERKEEGYYRSERSYGEFRRVIPLPEGIEAEGTSATFDDGVLEIRMKQPKKHEGKRIEIASGEKPEVH